jgi:hypothetical protein
MLRFFRWIKIFLIFLIIFSSIVFFLTQGYVFDWKDISYGLTFSKKQAQELSLDWQKLYQDILVDLKVKKIRLPVYWDEVENKQGVFEWNDLDWQVDQAELSQAGIILAIGARVPRWPECHLPDWTEILSQTEIHTKQLNYIKAVVDRYKDKKNIIAWQVENEPFLKYFGECPPLDINFLDIEIETVRSLDSRPIIITDSGELSVWYPAAKRADIFGTSIYRNTYSTKLEKYIHYPLSPKFFLAKKNLVGLFAKPQKWIVIELQGEPWGKEPYQNLSLEERNITMDLVKFKETAEYARQTGFQEFYWWGVEWWYWEKEIKQNPDLWLQAKILFNSVN